jgi:hypothetical protein
MKTNNLILVLSLFFLASCSAQKRVSTIVGGEYNKRKDVTEYFVFPFGSTSIPGKWIKEEYNRVSKQQFFKNDENVSIAVAFAPIGNFEFNTNKSKKEYEFVKAYYDWEADYFTQTHKMKTELIEKDEKLKYIIWRVFDDSDNKRFDTYFLLGEKNGNANNFSISITDKWTRDKKIEILKVMFYQ